MTAAQPSRRIGAGGVRELRQNLSVYLERVIAGERLEVTDRGNPVAMLIPIRPSATLVERLVAEGRATAARIRPADVPPLQGAVSSDLGERLQRALPELREDRLSSSLPVYLDSSALLKLVLPESERAALESALAPWPDRLDERIVGRGMPPERFDDSRRPRSSRRRWT